MNSQRNSTNSVSEIRSRTMRAVKSKGNATTELKMRNLLRASGLNGWRRHLPIRGQPDFAWRKEKVALFVDGCFWHHCPYCNHRLPVNNAKYWADKFLANTRRDRKVTRMLRAEGWSVIRVWEHTLRNPAQVANRIERALRARRPG